MERPMFLDSDVVVDPSGHPHTVYFAVDDTGRPFDGVAWIETGRLIVDQHLDYEDTDYS